MTASDLNAQTQRPAIRVQKAQHLFDALRSPDYVTRISMLKAVAAHPEKALSYGPCCGMTLVDELLSQLNQSRDTGYRLGLLAALAAFREERIVVAFQRILLGTRDHQTLLLAASRLSDEPEESLREFLSPLLFDDSVPIRARMVAGVMKSYRHLEPVERIRIVSLTDAPFPIPPFDDSTEALWIAELERGSHRARRILESLGEKAFLRLKKRWSTQPAALKMWVVEWGVRDHAVHALDLLADVFQRGSRDLVLAGLRALEHHRQAAGLFRDRLEMFATHDEKEIRLAAWKAGTGIPEKDIRRLLAKEKTVEVKIEMIRQLASEAGERAVPDLVALLHAEAWEIRAAATEGLIFVGEPAAGAVKPLRTHSRCAVRAAAAKILVENGKEEWLVESCAV